MSKCFAMSLTASAALLLTAGSLIVVPPVEAQTTIRQVDELQTIPPVVEASPSPLAIAPALTPDPPIASLPGLSADTPPTPAPAARGDIVVTARPRGDPLRRANLASFKATQAVDDAVIGPAAHAYERIVPKPVRGGLRNFFYNLREPTVFVNYLLQLKPGKAAETLGRFAVNTTIGLVGVMDLAKRRPFNLPRRPNSFGNTLGYYGVKPGPFMFLPLIGPTTLRDLIGSGIDRLALPSLVGGRVGGTAYVATTASIKLLDRRLRLDDDLRAIRSGPRDPYTARRALYLKKRQTEIEHLHSGYSDPVGTNLPDEPSTTTTVLCQGVEPKGIRGIVVL